MTGELLLIVKIADREVALCAAEVQAVIELETPTPIPLAPLHVAGLSALRSRVLTVIDCQLSLGLSADGRSAERHQAVVVEQDGHHYALLVDEVVDVTPAVSDLSVMRADPGQGWAVVSLGMVETGMGLMLLVNIGALITGGGQARAA